MSEYRRVLHAWVKNVIAEAVSIQEVRIDYSKGGAWSDVTFEDPQFDVFVRYRNKAGEDLSIYLDGDEHATRMGGLLSELFKIAEGEDSQ